MEVCIPINRGFGLSYKLVLFVTALAVGSGVSRGEIGQARPVRVGRCSPVGGLPLSCTGTSRRERWPAGLGNDEKWLWLDGW